MPTEFREVDAVREDSAHDGNSGEQREGDEQNKRQDQPEDVQDVGRDDALEETKKSIQNESPRGSTGETDTKRNNNHFERSIEWK